MCCLAYTRAEIHLKWEVNKANNSVNQVLDTASQNRFMPREKHNEEEQEIGKFTVLLRPGLGAKWRKILQW